MISMNSKSCASWPYLPSFLFCSVFEQETILYSRVLAVLNSYYHMWACNLTERKNLQNSDCRLRFLCENFRLCSRYNNVNYGARYVYKPLFGSSVVIYPPREMVGHSTIWQVAWPCQILPPPPRTGPESPWRNSSATSEDFYNSSYHNEGLENKLTGAPLLGLAKSIHYLMEFKIKQNLKDSTQI